MKFYDEIKERLIDNEIYSKVKDYSKENYKLKTYYEVGKLLSEAGKKYGKGIIKNYSFKLSNDFNKNISTTLLKRIRQFYIIIQKGATMSHQLTWSHYQELSPLKDINIINYYINVVENNILSLRELRSRIKSKEYERLLEETKVRLINKEDNSITDLIPNPIIIKNKNNYEVINEKVLKRIILEDIETFMKELGNSFCFIGSEYKIKIGNSFNYIDLLLFNIEYNCYVVVELKVIELKKEHIGQIEIYMNYIDKNIRGINNDKTIGIIVCKKDNEFVIEYSSDKRIIARYYEFTNRW